MVFYMVYIQYKIKNKAHLLITLRACNIRESIASSMAMRAIMNAFIIHVQHQARLGS